MSAVILDNLIIITYALASFIAVSIAAFVFKIGRTKFLTWGLPVVISAQICLAVFMFEANYGDPNDSEMDDSTDFKRMQRAIFIIIIVVYILVATIAL